MTDLKPYLYTSKVDAALDADFANALRCHQVKAGETGIFWKSFVRWYTVPYSRIKRIFRRVQDVRGRLCCGGRNFRIERLVLILDDDTELELYIGDDVGKDAAAFLQSLQTRRPEILYGKP